MWRFEMKGAAWEKPRGARKQSGFRPSTVEAASQQQVRQFGKKRSEAPNLEAEVTAAEKGEGEGE
jgi:hypothetical protein